MDNLTALADHHLEIARRAPHGRSAHLFLRDGPLRQSVIALTSGSELDEHDSPPAGSVQILRGAVRFIAASGDQDIPAGLVWRLPQERHSVRALEDSVMLLTAVTAVAH